MDLNLSGQAVVCDEIRPKLGQLKSLMEQRRSLWDRLSVAQRREWVQLAPTKDPVMDLAVDVFRYLSGFLKEAEDSRG